MQYNCENMKAYPSQDYAYMINLLMYLMLLFQLSKQFEVRFDHVIDDLRTTEHSPAEVWSPDACTDFSLLIQFYFLIYLF